MFTLNQIQEAHSKVKSGADFPRYVQELIDLGVKKYDYYVSDGHSVYLGKDGSRITSEAKYTFMPIAEESDAKGFAKKLKAHQQGKLDFPAFCKQTAEAGVEKWTVDMEAMRCVYYDRKGVEILVEEIPEV